MVFGQSLVDRFVEVEGVREMLGLETIVVLGALFGFLVYAMVRTELAKGWAVWPSSVDDPSVHR